MTQKEKELLFKDLCARLPYGVKIYSDGIPHEQTLIGFIPDIEHYNIKPYLRPMSSMTEEEREEFCKVGGVMSYNPQHDTWAISAFALEAYDWLNKHHFDYRGLIPKSLALEASKDMYKF